MSSKLILLGLCLAVLASGCLPERAKSPAPVFRSEGVLPSSGPYWQGEGEVVTFQDLMAYYSSLASLADDELEAEHQRLGREREAGGGGPINRLQRLMMALLPDKSVVPVDEGLTLVAEMQGQDQAYGYLGDFLELAEDQLAARQAHLASEGDCQRELAASHKRAGAVAAELRSCRRERGSLVKKLQKLREIEQGSMAREGK